VLAYVVAVLKAYAVQFMGIISGHELRSCPFRRRNRRDGDGRNGSVSYQYVKNIYDGHYALH
jgi:hypothetical protein